MVASGTEVSNEVQFNSVLPYILIGAISAPLSVSCGRSDIIKEGDKHYVNQKQKFIRNNSWRESDRFVNQYEFYI